MLRRQLTRFAIVGLASNALLFALYLLLTTVGLSPPAAMTLVYAVGVVQTFIANRSWTFSHAGRAGGPFVRYVLSYLLGYLVNLALLVWLVDVMKLPHAWVQGVMIFVVAVLVFTLQRHWVFPADTAGLPRRT